MREADALARRARERARAASDGLSDTRRVLSDSDRARAVDMAGDGIGPTAIARALGRKAPTVAYYLSTQGLTRTTQVDEAPTYLHGGQRRRRFTRAEDALAERMSMEGSTLEEIAAACTAAHGHPRTGHTVRIRLRNLGSLDDEGRDAAARQGAAPAASGTAASAATSSSRPTTR